METRNRELGFRRSRRPNPSPSSSSSIDNRSHRSNFPHRNTKNAPEVSHCSGPSITQEQRIEIGEDPQKFPSVIGTCSDMCPAKERAQRERLRDLSVFERLNGNPAKTSPTLAVKKFCRTLSTMHLQASDIRSLPVLKETLKYLFKLLDSSEHPFEVIYEFVFDRTRSIRQDLSMQNINNYQAIHLYEEMVKFHIISHHKLLRCSGKNSSISSLCYLNMEQLIKSLMSLHELYGINRSSNSNIKNEAEFYSFYVLLHLGSKSKSTGESISLWFRQLPLLIVKSQEMRFARSILRYLRMGNYKRFFDTTAAEASYLQFCLIEPFINEVRAQAVSYINYGGYKLHPYPLVHLSKVLMMKESEAESFCKECGLNISTDEAGSKLLPTKQTDFCLPKGGFQNYGFSGLERLQRVDFGILQIHQMG